MRGLFLLERAVSAARTQVSCELCKPLNLHDGGDAFCTARAFTACRKAHALSHALLRDSRLRSADLRAALLRRW